MKILAAMSLIFLLPLSYAGGAYLEYDGVKYNIKSETKLDENKTIVLCKYPLSGSLYGYYVFIKDSNNKILYKSNSSGDSKPKTETLGFFGKNDTKSFYMTYATEESDSFSVFYNQVDSFEQFVLSEEADYLVRDLNGDGVDEVLVSVYELDEFYGADEYPMIFYEKIYSITNAGLHEVDNYSDYKEFFKDKLEEYKIIKSSIDKNKEKDMSRYIINFDIYKNLLDKYIVRSKKILESDLRNL